MIPSLAARMTDLSDVHATAIQTRGRPAGVVTVAFGAGGVRVELVDDVELVRGLLTDALAQLDAMGLG